MTNSVNVMSE